MAGTSSILGVISGLDTQSILDKLRTVAEQPITNLKSQKSTLSDKATAWDTLDAKLTALQTSVARLSKASTFQTHTATSSDTGLVSASASTSAVPGSYTFSVEQLAQNGQVISQGYADADMTELGSGRVTVTVGGSPVDIQADGMTLNELRDAINSAAPDVTASVINDGSDTSPYRLVITAKETGADRAVSVTSTISGGNAPTFTELQAAQDAVIKLGSGSNAVSISSRTNRVTTAIPGVTLDLLGAEPGHAVTVTVANDTGSVETLVQNFVGAYNDINSYFSEQFKYDPETQTSGTLFGDYRLLSIQNDLRNTLFGQVAGIDSGIRSLSDLGITTLSTGELSIDSVALQNALSSNLDGVMKVFAATGTTTNAAVSFVSTTTDTRASGAGGYAVEITQAARQARVTAGVAMSGALTSDESLNIGGLAIGLTAGMTQAEVLAEVNAQQSQTGVRATLTGADGTGVGSYLTLSRVAYGSAYHVTAFSTLSNGGSGSTGFGTSQVSDTSPVGEAGGTGAAGLNVEGTIGGDAATGSGERLTGSEGDAKGLCLLITATTAGSYGEVAITTGVGARGLQSLVSATDSVNGTISVAQTAITDQQSSIDAEIARLQALVDADIARTEKAFASMEKALAELQSQSQQLSSFTAQLASMNSTSNSS